MGHFKMRLRQKKTAARSRSVRPLLESLEDRMLLYATEGALWQYSTRITYSFVADGTSIGGVASNMFATLNAKYATATWQAQFEKAAATWETYGKVNLALVSDNGEPLGANGNQQDDPNVGDIRISMIPMGTSQGVLAYALAPPPLNGGTEAGDIVFNSSYAWGINNNNYDIETVALHEMGHALGLGESTKDSNAVMYPYYSGTDQNPDIDDQAGIAYLFGANAPSGTNKTQSKATNITSSITNNQIAMSGLTLDGATDVGWWSVTVPSSTTGTVSIAMQSTNLSSLSPRLLVYKGTTTTLLGQAALPNVYGGTARVTLSGVTPGEVLTFRTSAASSPGAYGSYGLLVNFGSAPQAPIQPPNTAVAWAPSQGGGSSDESTPPPPSGSSGGLLGGLLGGIGGLLVGVLEASLPPGPIQIGNVTAYGDPIRTTTLHPEHVRPARHFHDGHHAGALLAHTPPAGRHPAAHLAHAHNAADAHLARRPS